MLIYAPNILKDTWVGKDGKVHSIQIINAPREKYLEKGWYFIVKQDRPDEDMDTENGYWQPNYELIDNEIIQSWDFIEFEENE